MTFRINGVKVSSDLPDFTEAEAARYVAYVAERVDDPLKEITVKLCADGCVDLSYLALGTPFERIRRITGYRATRLHMKSMHA